ncbi:MAG: metallophosphoesterase family protein [Bryobacteraceae bacterium]
MAGRVIVHLSDLHFGRVDPRVLAPLVRTVYRLDPNLVAVSGDLTQNARHSEFFEASRFLRLLPQPQIVVPGNHDMAFLNPFRRATQGLNLYHHYITQEREPFFRDPEVAVLGLNTARIALWRGGRINEKQVMELQRRMRQLNEGVTRVLVTHHPFDLPARYGSSRLVGRRMIEKVLAHVDLLLAGHMHISHAAPTAERHKVEGQSAVFVQAGTATSTRVRGEANSFKVIRVERPRVTVEQYAWEPGHEEFTLLASSCFRHTPGGWTHDHDEGEPTEEPVAEAVVVHEGEMFHR